MRHPVRRALDGLLETQEEVQQGQEGLCSHILRGRVVVLALRAYELNGQE